MTGTAPEHEPKSYVREVWETFRDACRSLSVVFRTMLRPAVCIRYPEEKRVPRRGFRGALVFDADACTACGQCVKACPSDCIRIRRQAGEQGKRAPELESCSIDLGRCSFCGLCEEACPVQPSAVRHSLDYELVFFSRDEMVRWWKPGFPPAGRCRDPRSGGFRDPDGQVLIQTEQERPERS